jgi:hypothetical protein
MNGDDLAYIFWTLVVGFCLCKACCWVFFFRILHTTTTEAHNDYALCLMLWLFVGINGFRCALISTGVPREDVPRWLCRFRGTRVNLLDESHERRDLQARYVGPGYS